jgi:lipopolysaccharide transport system ATP-binding protein
MKSDSAIEICGLGKQYRITGAAAPYRTLRDSIVDAAMGPLRAVSPRTRRSGNKKVKTGRFWALKDVSFTVQQGSVVGIIGRNGAGKSTLLKIISRITEPTEGYVDVCGRVGSLLEVGTGFHPELSGRENILLSGSILGMRRAEILRKFDEIVAFAEVEQFVDTPVKHYSSGMYLRLAFAVAAHLEPEILLVDEVLAVGDARFQRKCMDKMQDVGQRGRTVLFVSHTMSAITRLCARAIMLDAGQVCADGPAPEVVGAYLNSGLGTMAAREWIDPRSAPGGDVVRLQAVRVRATDGAITDAADIRQPVGIEMEYEVLKPGYVLLPHFSVHTSEGILAFTANDQDPQWRGRPRQPGRYVSVGWIPGNFLAEGTMFIGPAMRTLGPDTVQFYERDAVAFQVIDCPGADTARGDYPGKMPGVVRPLLKWTTEACSDNAYRAREEEAPRLQPL